MAGAGYETELGELVASLTRDVEDFPKPGVSFKDLTPLLANGPALGRVTAGLFARFGSVDLVAGIEARGFLFGAPVALALGVGFLPLRKPGKLPPPVLSRNYALEYGTDSLELRADLLPRGARLLLIDDVLATGGTAGAAISLLRELGADVVGLSVVLEIGFLGGRERLAPLGVDLASLLVV